MTGPNLDERVVVKNHLKKLPGWIGTGLITFLNAIWLYWGLGEAFYEGWGVPETPWFLFLAIGFAAIILSVVTIKFPYFGGGLLIAAGLFFAIWWLIPGIKTGFYSLSVALERLFLSGGFTIVGILFILDAIYNPKKDLSEKPWYIRNLRLILTIGIPLLVLIIVFSVNLPVVLTRIDDGNRSSRRIVGYKVDLIWAPEGPGWNWKQDFGGYPSWNALASYGIEPLGLDSDKLPAENANAQIMEELGLCAFLSEDGKQLLDEPQYIWRLPSVDEITGSLSLHNENSRCSWDGEIGKLSCDLHTDKETPLWAPDQPPVYYWAADPLNDEDAYYVSYTGYVSHQPKTWGNPRHGYRCVKEP